MTEKRTRFRKIDVTRAIEAATAGGLKIGKIEIEPAGKIVLYAGEAVRTAGTPFDEWKAKRDAHAA